MIKQRWRKTKRNVCICCGRKLSKQEVGLGIKTCNQECFINYVRREYK